MRNVVVASIAFAIFFTVAGCDGKDANSEKGGSGGNGGEQTKELRGEKELKRMLAGLKEQSQTKDNTKLNEAVQKTFEAQVELTKLNLTQDELIKLQEKYKKELAENPSAGKYFSAMTKK